MGNKPVAHREFAGVEYIRGRVLGKGAFGKVYAVQLAADKNFVRVVKEMSKTQIIQKGENTVNLLVFERHILTELANCPFVVKSYCSTQDTQHLYLLLEFCPGGELDFHLCNLKHMPENHVRFYAAELIVALDNMHRRYRVVHRDLKPANILLDRHGHISVIDFNIAMKCNEEGNILNPKKKAVGTLPYMEILEGKDHGPPVDWWSLGIMLYELRNGTTPFEGAGDKSDYLKAIKNDLSKVPGKSRGTDEFKELLKGLLEADPTQRWKASKCKKCKFFEGIKWKDVKQKKLEAPITPDKTRINFKADASMEEAFGMNKVKEMPITEKQQELFTGWDWTCDDQQIPEEYKDKIEARKSVAKIKTKESKKRGTKNGDLKTSQELNKS